MSIKIIRSAKAVDDYKNYAYDVSQLLKFDHYGAHPINWYIGMAKPTTFKILEFRLHCVDSNNIQYNMQKAQSQVKVINKLSTSNLGMVSASALVTNLNTI